MTIQFQRRFLLEDGAIEYLAIALEDLGATPAVVTALTTGVDKGWITAEAAINIVKSAKPVREDGGSATGEGSTFTPGTGMQYTTKKVNEGYGYFKNEIRTRTKPEQLHQAVKGIRKKVDEINKLFEYCRALREELSESQEQFAYGARTEALIKKSQEGFREAFKKLDSITGKKRVEEILTPEDYKKAQGLLNKIESTYPKLYQAIANLVIDIYPHKYKEIEDLTKANLDRGTINLKTQ